MSSRNFAEDFFNSHALIIGVSLVTCLFYATFFFSSYLLVFLPSWFWFPPTFAIFPASFLSDSPQAPMCLRWSSCLNGSVNQFKIQQCETLISEKLDLNKKPPYGFYNYRVNEVKFPIYLTSIHFWLISILAIDEKLQIIEHSLICFPISLNLSQIKAVCYEILVKCMADEALGMTFYPLISRRI